MSEPTLLITQAAIEALVERLRRNGLAYHIASPSLSRRAAFKEVSRITIALEEALDIPVFFDRLDGNHFELWIESRS